MVRYPMGGNLSWGLNHLLGLKDLGHDVFLVEKYVYDESCFDPVNKIMTNDCSYGIKVVSDLLKRFGLENKWCFVEKGEVYHGLSKQEIQEVFRTADLYIDSGANHAWMEESQSCGLKVWIDGDPGFTQFKFSHLLAEKGELPFYDYYFTNGTNIGSENNIIPTCGITWNHFYSPVKTAIFNGIPPPSRINFSTVMNWQSYEQVVYNAEEYGHKDLEFAKFMMLPLLVKNDMEVAVSGKNVPSGVLSANKWIIKNGHEVTISFDSFLKYIASSAAEFSVCKQGYVKTNSGWFSDKSAAYLAAGRPVVLQDTGFSSHLPVGKGLFAVSSVTDAQLAIEELNLNYMMHSDAAKEISREYFEAEKCFKMLLKKINF
jgi:hypothetical protein